MCYLKKITSKFNILYMWGTFRATISSASGYGSWISYGMQAVTLYYVTNQDMPFWIYITCVVGFVIGILIFERVFSIKSAYLFMNRQAWDNYNPMREKLEEHDKKLDKIMKKLGIDD